MSIDLNNLPSHVAFILDGNGRWAEKRKLSRSAGHDEGLRTIKKIVKDACDLGIKYLTLYVFSTENWKRTQDEVGFLMNLIHIHLRNELAFYKENEIKLNHLGDISALPKNIQKDIIDAMDDTKAFNKMTVNLAINYGGRDEILRGIKKLFKEKNNLDDFSEKDFSEYLDMKESPDVDLVIRTGGEQRLSNFLLWHVPYAEFIYSDTLWPDYTKEEFYKHIEEFQHRNRRFGSEKSRK
ncbi:MAG: di-trans,poly-cis-decaprenylcistransferase [Treponema sp.]|nr:di-trans,poly-cis-decaprenylcistransferase [Treponema sp.]